MSHYGDCLYYILLSPQIEQTPLMRFVCMLEYLPVIQFTRFSEGDFWHNCISLSLLSLIFLYGFFLNLEILIAQERQFVGKRLKILYIKPRPQFAQGVMVFWCWSIGHSTICKCSIHPVQFWHPARKNRPFSFVKCPFFHSISPFSSQLIAQNPPSIVLFVGWRLTS